MEFEVGKTYVCRDGESKRKVIYKGERGLVVIDQKDYPYFRLNDGRLFNDQLQELDLVKEYIEPVTRTVNLIMYRSGKVVGTRIYGPEVDTFKRNYPHYEILSFKKITMTEGEIEEGIN